MCVARVVIYFSWNLNTRIFNSLKLLSNIQMSRTSPSNVKTPVRCVSIAFVMRYEITFSKSNVKKSINNIKTNSFTLTNR